MQQRRIALTLAVIIAVTGSTTAFALVDAPKVSSFAAGQNQRTDLTSAKAEQQKTTSGSLQLRESASTTSKSLMDIPKNATVTVTETPGDWSRISYKTMTVGSPPIASATSQRPRRRCTTTPPNTQRCARTPQQRDLGAPRNS